MQLTHFLLVFKIKKNNRKCSYNIVVTSCFRYKIVFYLFYDQLVHKTSSCTRKMYALQTYFLLKVMNGF